MESQQISGLRPDKSRRNSASDRGMGSGAANIRAAEQKAPTSRFPVQHHARV